MRDFIKSLANPKPDFIKQRLYLHTVIVALFLITMIFVSAWTGNTLTMITAIARFERTHTVSRLEAKTALLEYVNDRDSQSLALFYEKMAITQSYNKVFSSLLTMRTTKSDKEFAQILENTFKEADHKTAVIIVNRIKILYWHSIIKELVSYAVGANQAGEKIVALMPLVVAAPDKEKQQSVLMEIKNAETDFIFNERSFSKRCSDLANEIAAFVDYISITILILSIGFISLITYLITGSLFQQAIRHARELEESQKQYRNLVEGTPDLITRVDTEGRFVFVNHASLDIYGLSPDECIGRTAFDFIHPEDRESTMALFQNWLTQAGEIFTHENRQTGIDGREHYMAWSIYSEKDENGNVTGFASSAKDITSQKLAEAALLESEITFRKLFADSSDAILLIDGKGVFVECNQAALDLLKMTREQFLLLPPARISPEFQPDGRRSAESAPDMIALAYSKGLHRFDWVCVNAEGGEFIVEVSLMPIVIKGQTMLHTTWRDITGRKLAEEEKIKLETQLLQAQKMESVGRLAGGVAHDFNNMLGVIIGHAEMALENVNHDQPIHEDLSEILKAAERSADLTKQLLAFARKQTIAPKVLDLNETVAGMLKMLQRLIGEDIHLTWQPAANLWQVKMDPTQIDQILANLCVNARDAITNVGQITIETLNCTFDDDFCANYPDFLPGDYILLAISDNGRGMDKKTLAQIFEPFFTTKGLGEGTGLGLSTVYGVVRQNNGLINVYSEPGHGTTFKIYLPRYMGKTEQAITEKTTMLIKGGHETILLVEDEPAFLNLTKKMLEQHGYTVLTANNPNDAIQMAREHSGEISLLITDVIMPEMNGRDLAGRLLLHHSHLKYLFMSGYTADLIAHHGVLDDGVHFIQKPFTTQTLAAKIREVLDK